MWGSKADLRRLPRAKSDGGGAGTVRCALSAAAAAATEGKHFLGEECELFEGGFVRGFACRLGEECDVQGPRGARDDG